MNSQEEPWRELINGVCEGDDEACHDFWQQYGVLIERVAEQHLAGGMRRRIGSESVAVSVCRTFFRRAQQGEFRFADEQAPWRLLCAIAVTKIREKVRFHRRQKRGLDREIHVGDKQDEDQRQYEFSGGEPSPDAIAEFNDELEQLIAALPEEEQQVLELRLQQCTQEEIAEKLQCSERTVRRMMKRIQSHLTRLLESETTGPG